MMADALQSSAPVLRARAAVGRYLLLENLGSGGQSEIWSAWDEEHHRVVALKQLLGEAILDSSDEYKLTLALSHPCIVRIHEFTIQEGAGYIVMDYYPFGSLETLIKQGPLRTQAALRIFRDMVDALSYTHARRIVHRDLKPRNVLIDARQHAYLTDFGIARSLSRSTQAFHTGQGTIAYSPPEQHNLSALSIQSDIYSLGIMLYEMLTGDLPWKGEVALATMQMSRQLKMPNPNQANPELPARLIGPLRRMTAYDPDQRPASALEAWEEIRAVFGVSDADYPSALGHDMPGDAQALLAAEVEGASRDATRSGPLSHFALIHGAQLESTGSLDATQYEALLRLALLHDFKHEYWWRRAPGASERLAACESLLTLDLPPAASERLIKHMLAEPELLPEDVQPSPLLFSSLVSLLDGPAGENALNLLDRLLPDSLPWEESRFGLLTDLQVADLAAGEHAESLRIAGLLGRLHSQTAFEKLAASPGAGPALLAAWRGARSLPPGVTLQQQVGLAWELLRQAFSADTLHSLTIWGLAALGCGLGVGLHIFTGYRWLTLLDSGRLLNAIGGGLLVGPLLGLAVTLARLMPARLDPLPGALRVALGALSGLPWAALALLSYHLLFLNAPVEGVSMWLFTGLLLLNGSLFAGWFKAAPARMLWSSVLTAFVLWASWEWHLRSASSPLLFYDVSPPDSLFWPLLLTALPMGTLPYWGATQPASPDED